MEYQATPRFIVIDDDHINNHICRMSIRLLYPDAQVETFIEPDKGLEYIAANYSEANPVDTILLLDINMPVMNGWEVLDIFMGYPLWLRQQFRIYILSSSVATEDKIKAGENDLITGFIEKPLTKVQLQQYLFAHTI